jgi:hypothetical protein
VLINGPEERTIPGNALSVHPDLPFRGLERFGVSFLSRFEGSQMPSSVLRSVNLVDTPGVLSGEKQRTNRGYDFTKVVAWFAEVSACPFICPIFNIPHASTPHLYPLHHSSSERI